VKEELKQRWSIRVLGFNDTRFIFIGIGLMGLIMPIAFFGLYPFAQPKSYAIGVAQSLFFGFIYWLVDRYVFIKLVERYPDIKDTRKRQTITVSIIVTWTLFFSLFSKSCSLAFIPQYEHPIPKLLQLTIGSLIVTSVVYSIYESLLAMNRWRRSVKQTEALKRESYRSQLESLKNQVNPHFLFNSLNTLSASIHSEPDMAVEFVQNMSEVYRYVLETKHQEFVELREELKNIERFIFLLKARFGEKLRINIAPELMENKQHIVPLALQMLLENAIKHNVVSTAKPLSISITKSKEGHLVVRNNYQPKLRSETSTGTGLNNINKRYKLQSGVEIDIIHSEQYFTVVLPLLKIEAYADSDY